jgi:hypothetical protein
LKSAIYTSTNSGTTWIQTSAPSNVWVSVASSADGNRLVAAAQLSSTLNSTNFIILTPNGVWTSADSGATWISNNVPPLLSWEGVASSADGTKLVAVAQVSSNVFTSTNSGATWISNGVPNLVWISVASSADGNGFVAADLDPNGGIWTSQSTPSPQLNLASTDTNFVFCWTIPSTNFVLQQSADLVSWADVTNPPVLNLTNLQNQVTLTPSNSSDFYRLSTP